MKKNIRKRIAKGIRYILGCITILLLQETIGQTNNRTETLSDRFDEIHQILEENYYETGNIHTGKMQDSALKAYVDAIEDPYTMYLDNATNSGFQEELKWSQDFEGIWAVIGKKEYYIIIEELIKWSPAAKGWLYPLDRIIAIDGVSTKDISITDAVTKIRGPKWTKVKLDIERIDKKGSKEILEKDIIRDKLSIPSVKTEIVKKWEKSFAHIIISMIWEETESILKQQLIEIKEKNIDGVILDLRWNWWWILPISVKIASHFIPKDKLVVSSRYKQLGEESFYSEGYSDLEGIPVVVLIDEMTASAWEIIALALQEQINAKIIGKQSFGKGTIQTIYEFNNGTSLKYTIGKRYSPSGKNIDKIGVAPDIQVTFDAEIYKNTNRDTQLEKAISTISEMK